VRSAATNFAIDDDGGSYDTSVEFINRIDLSGATI
jgi:hypothetical protein